ncbi:cytochrome b [Lichenihabitans sp. Uapishka_5]|uniref:cytochrome b n=1 Tax=Lichenihabitans sp. Uapishka_5 TaxID=3037302 RepID=UPI0029E7E271|nr:cytochrome b [Lichenihabitans sp. Uapishka_5]MDX7951641.1 cytochrome b [Lichenihabitans sp. Uapishka_5]
MSAKAITPAERYTAVAQAFHWLLALALIGIVIMGLAMAHAPLTPATKFKLYQLHKSVGITILALAVLRLLWRLTHRPPPLPADMPALEKAGAHGAHVVLYGLMIGLPLVGWALVSISPFNLPTVLYGILPWPHISALSSLPRATKAAWEPTVAFVHAYGAYLLIALVGVHVLAALRHHFIIGDDTLRRMLPGRRRPIMPRNPAE